MDSITQSVTWIAYLACAVPLSKAWQANQGASLRHSIAWSFVAWLAGLVVLYQGNSEDKAWSYIALCLTGAMGIAVLGARRPGASAWHFVVMALLGVQLMPLLEASLRGGFLELDGLRITCLAGTLAVGILNYLPTRFGPAALMMLAACCLQLHSLLLGGGHLVINQLALSLVPWIALACRRQAEGLAEWDRGWLHFRDRYGMLWGQRVREQLNLSAAHAKLPATLRWSGFDPHEASSWSQEQRQQVVTILQALVKRFEPDKSQGALAPPAA